MKQPSTVAVISLGNMGTAIAGNLVKGKTAHGSIGLWVDIGTIGYFRDLKVTMKSIIYR